MAKSKQLGKDRFGVQKVMRKRDYFGDSLGQFALNAIAGLVGQITYFYTDKVGLAAGSVATAFLVAKIIDAFTDIFMGYIVDHTKPGKERYRPWLLKMAVPVAIIIFALFTVPSGWSETGKFIYMLVTNVLLTAVIYTAICIPYVSLQVVRTDSQEERGKMGTYRAVAGYISGMIVAICIIPVTNALGGTQSAWIKFGAVFAILSMLCLLLCYKTSIETHTKDDSIIEIQEKEDKQVELKDSLNKLFHNKYWVMVLVLNFIVNVSYGITNTSGTYYCKWIYGNDNLVGILGAVGLIPTLIGFIAVGPMIRKLGVTKTLKVSFAIGIISTALKIVNPYDFVYNTVLGCFGTFANIPMMCLLGVLTAMTIDYNEYKYGVRMVAISQSAASFGMKVGTGIGAAVVGWCLAIAGYNASLQAATTATKNAIFTFAIYIPLILFITMFIISMKFDLESKLPEYMKEVKSRKADK